MSNTHLFEHLQGIYVGHYHTHGFEIIKLCYHTANGLHSLLATKLTGDTYVPAGKPTFQIQTSSDTPTLPIFGQGHIANYNYTTPSFIPGRLIAYLPDFSAFVFEWIGLGGITFVRRQVQDESNLVLDAQEQVLMASLMRDFVQTLSIDGLYANQYQVGNSKSLNMEQVQAAITACQVQHEHRCVICLSNVESEEQASQILKCKHMFHTECITNWLIRCAECPLCKTSLK